jgi:transcriptional regulator with XRE-family HTH domain
MKHTNNEHLLKLGNRMRELRVKAGHSSLEKFAFHNNISRVLYSNWEAGRGNITFKNLVKVCTALNVTVGAPFGFKTSEEAADFGRNHEALYNDLLPNNS